MYVNPFFGGILATILAELLALFLVMLFRGGDDE